MNEEIKPQPLKFHEFPKIPRFSRDVVITEKCDGTNASIYIAPLSDIVSAGGANLAVSVRKLGDVIYAILTASRTRWITPSSDNFGFSKWVVENADELIKLGPGMHRGEWWGQSINRNYGLKERRYSLFSVDKWRDPLVRPACCSVVPTIITGNMDDINNMVDFAMHKLRTEGSLAAPGWEAPEGIVIYLSSANLYLKKTLENDSVPKSKLS